MKLYLWISVAIIVISINLVNNFTGIHSYHAVYVYDLIKNTKWPEDKKNDRFIIGVFGQTAVMDELKVLSQKKKAGEKEIEIKELKSLEDVSDCNIAYLRGLKKEALDEAICLANEKNVLVVTEGHEMSKKGAPINFISNEGKLEYEVNTEAAKDAQLSFSSSIISNGKVLN